jgi:ribosomal protein S27AE
MAGVFRNLKRYDSVAVEKKMLTGKRQKCPMCKMGVGVFLGEKIKCWNCGYVIYKEDGW